MGSANIYLRRWFSSSRSLIILISKIPYHRIWTSSCSKWLREACLPADIFNSSPVFKRFNHGDNLMLSKRGFTHSDLLHWQIDYAGGSLNVNGTIMRDIYNTSPTLSLLQCQSRGMVHIDVSKSISDQRAKRSSLERMKISRVSSVAQRVSGLPV